jgi:hypothetical protein
LKGIKGSDTGISDPRVKQSLHENIISFTSRSVPQGAAKSMSPYLLANSFQLDFYELYRAVSDQKEKLKKERQLLIKQ